MAKRFDLCSPRPKKDGGTWWHRVGTAFQNDKGLITCFLDSYPTPDEEGKVKCCLFEPREEKSNSDEAM